MYFPFSRCFSCLRDAVKRKMSCNCGDTSGESQYRNCKGNNGKNTTDIGCRTLALTQTCTISSKSHMNCARVCVCEALMIK